jgi:hypothetical protein
MQKTFKNAQYTLQLNQNRHPPKRPLELPQEKTSTRLENNENSLKNENP